MKVVVTARGETLSSEVDPRFGRAARFNLVDTETSELESVENTKAQLAHGAGIQAAALVSELGAQAVITGRCGPKALSTLRAASIRVFTGASGTVSDALDQLAAGSLTEEVAGKADAAW